MPSLGDHPSTSIIRLLNIGESGSGKTGAMASLVAAGYNLWILDFDNGLDILSSAIRNHYRDDPAGLTSALSRVNYELLRDPIAMDRGVPTIRKAEAWKKAGPTLNSWGFDSFTNRDVVVIDTLTTASQAAFNESLSLNARLNKRPQESDYGWMADSVLLFIQLITDDSVQCNVIVNTHVRYMHSAEEVSTNSKGVEVASGSMRGLPNAKGQQISKDIGKFFNTVITTKTIGQGPGAKRLISTKPQGVVEVKTSNPFGVKPTYSVEDGLAPLFADILGHGPPSPSPPAPTVQTT